MAGLVLLVNLCRGGLQDLRRMARPIAMMTFAGRHLPHRRNCQRRVSAKTLSLIPDYGVCDV